LSFIAVYSLTVIAFFVTGRYRVPLLPLLAIGAAYTLNSIYDALRGKAFAQAVLMIGASAAAVGLLSIDYLGVRNMTSGFTRLTLAQDKIDAGDLDGGIPDLERIRREGTVRAPEVYKTLARAYLARGRPEDLRSAFEVAEDGLRSYPEEAELLWYSAVGHFDNKDYANAKDRVRRFLAREPQNLRALYLGFATAMALGDTSDAESYAARAEAVDPQNPTVRQMRQALQ
jgi:predicted Zn-dependent protease